MSTLEAHTEFIPSAFICPTEKSEHFNALLSPCSLDQCQNALLQNAYKILNLSGISSPWPGVDSNIFKQNNKT